VTRFLEQAGVEKVTGWSARLEAWGQPGRVSHAAPPADGHAVLTDGTYVRVAGSREAAGEAIRETFTWRGRLVKVDAIGVVAIRFSDDGKVVALAAGGLKSLSTKGLEISLPERTDIAFMTGPDGKTRGVLQCLAGEVPPTLLGITTDWQRLALPPSLPQARRAD
jgi:hypothetical protein